MRKKLFIICLSVMGFATQAQENLAHFKLLLIIRPNVNLPELSLVETTLSQEAIDAITFNYLNELPWLVDTMTGGMVSVETEVVVSQTPITFVGGDANGYYLTPEGCAEDIQTFSLPAQYDCIQVIYSLANLPHAAWGLTFPGSCFTAMTNYAGICTIENFTNSQDYYNRDIHVSEVFIHEWLHTLEYYYYDLIHATNMPSPGHLDAAQNLCYGTADHNLVEFYADHLTGTLYNYCEVPPIPLPAGSGFGPQAYQYPTPKELFAVINDSLIYSEDMRANNILLNPSFELLDVNNNPLNWETYYWFGTPIVFTTTHTEFTHENTSLYIKNEDMNLTYAYQTIAIEPNKQYMFIGDIKTQNVEAHETNHNIGAAFVLVNNWGSEWGYVDHIMGTHDWTRMVMLYHSQTHNSIRINCGMGYWSSAATGEVWFDNLWFGKISDIEMINSTSNITETPYSTTPIYLYKQNDQWVAENLNQQFNIMQIYDITGRLLKSVNIENANYITIATPDLPTGLLLLNFRGNKETTTLKFVNVQ